MSHKSHLILAIFLRVLPLAVATPAWSEGREPPGHFFNAYQLKTGTTEISALSQVKSAVHDELELNMFAGAYLLKPTFWNLGLKHKMFQTDRALTSFNSHSFIFKNGPDLYLASLHGVVTSIQIKGDQNLNLGLMDGLVMTFARTAQTSLHLITPLMGWDWVYSAHWSLAATFARPIYAIGQLESDDTGEGVLEIDFTKKNYNPGLGFLTASYSWNSFRLESGLVYLSVERGAVFPYLNLFWSFGG